MRDSTTAPPVGPQGAQPEVERLRAELGRLLADHRKDEAVDRVLAAVRSGAMPIPVLYTDVLGSLLVEIGSRWQRGETPVWKEHLASAAIRTMVESLSSDVARLAGKRTDTPARSALLACPPEEAHDLGLRMLADRLRLIGWRVHFLGEDTPFADLVAAARTLRVDSVILSVSTHFHLVRTRDLVLRLAEELPGVDIRVGGPAIAADQTGWFAPYRFDEEELRRAESERRRPGNPELGAASERRPPED